MVKTKLDQNKRNLITIRKSSSLNSLSLAYFFSSLKSPGGEARKEEI